MKSRGRNPAAMPVTADLFTPFPAARVIVEPAAPSVPALRPALTAVPRVDKTVGCRPCRLWYAVVFPELDESGALESLQRLSRYAQRFTSLVSIEMPNALLLEIRGSVTLFGSLQALLQALDAAWGPTGLPASSATATTTLAALWLARAHRPVLVEDDSALANALSTVPIACTAWDPERLQTLRSMGVGRLGELLRLPRAGLARRLGPAAVTDLDVALAKQAAPRRAFVPRERIRERCDFETEIETVLYLQKAVEPLLERCARLLCERQAGLQSFELRLRHRALPPTRLRVGLASVTSERRRLLDVVEEKLRSLELPAPVRGMELVSGPLRPLSGSSLDAFAGLRGAGRDTAPRLVERLRARLGEAAVYGVVSVAEHRPEAAWQRVRELSLNANGTGRMKRRSGERGVADRGAAQRSGHEMPRPVWLLHEPVRLSAADAQGLHPAWVLEQGPERIESGWWDGKDVARDYYIARQAQGGRWWIFQERQSRCWYMHGVFA